MLTQDNILHQNSGGVASATVGQTVTVSLAAGDTTDADSNVFVYFMTNAGTIPVPSGWVSAVGQGGLYGFSRGPAQGLTTGESSWNFTYSTGVAASPISWIVLEIAGLEDGSPIGMIDSTVTAGNGGGGTTIDTGTCALTDTYDGLLLAVYGSINDASAVIDTYSGYPAGYTEVIQTGQAGTAKSTKMLALVKGPVNQTGVYSAPITCSRALVNPSGGQGALYMLAAKGSRYAPNVSWFDGAEYGTTAGITLGPGAGATSYQIASSVVGSAAPNAAAARSGSFGWLISSTSAACNVAFNPIFALQALLTYRGAFRFSVLPSVDVEFLRFYNISVRFIAATGKIGLTLGTGTEVVSDQAITVNQWFGIDIRRSGPAQWSIDYNASLTDTTRPVLQAPATGSGGDSTVPLRIGWITTITGTLHVDDQAGTPFYTDYPLGDVRVLPLKVDPAATPTVSGATTGFGVMTNNGTVSAWNAVNARNAIDDVPPDLSATRDAAVCLTAAQPDYAEFPMQTVDLAGGSLNVRGVRTYAALWAASGTAATIRFVLAGDGATTYGTATQDFGQDNSATPVWVAALAHAISAVRVDWNQTKVDALAVQISSNDATPDIGVDCLLVELLVIKAIPEPLFGIPGEIYVEAARDPATNGLIGFTVTTPAGQGATVDYEVDGAPFSTGAIAGGSSQYVPVTADSTFPTVNKLTLKPD